MKSNQSTYANIYLPKELKEKAQKIAEKEERSLSSLVRYLLSRFIEEHERREEMMRACMSRQ